MCNCKICETIIGIIILVFTIWPALLGATTSMWIVIVSAAVLVVHSFACKNCAMCSMHGGSMPTKTGKRK